MTAIIHTGEPYQTARAIDRALEGAGWRVVPMHAEPGHAIRITRRNHPLFGDGVLVLTAGQQLVIDGDGALRVEPVPAAAAP